MTFSIEPTHIPGLRSFAWRLGRRMYCWARRDTPNDPIRNGEYWLLRTCLDSAKEKQVVLFDIGANRGEWTARALQSLDIVSKPGKIFCFEPASATFNYLVKRFHEDFRVEVHQTAVSDSDGITDFYISRRIRRHEFGVDG